MTEGAQPDTNAKADPVFGNMFERHDPGIILGGAGIGLVTAGIGWLAASQTAVVVGAVLVAVAVLLGGFGVVYLCARGTAALPSMGHAQRVLDVMETPAAHISRDGRIVTHNAAWKKRFPQNVSPTDLVPQQAQYRLQRAARHGVDDHHAHDGGHIRITPFDAESHIWSWHSPAQTVPANASVNAQDSMAGALSLVPFGVVALDGFDPLTSSIVASNTAFARMAGVLVSDGMAFKDILEHPSADEFKAACEKAETDVPISCRLRGDSPRDVHVFVARAADGFVFTVRDVSEQKQLEMQYAQGQKMQAIGQLAGGVAHDFNNLLTAINLRLDELLVRHPVGDPSYPELREIADTATRAGELVRKLLAFSRKQTFKRAVLDVGDLINDISNLMSRVLSEEVKLNVSHGRDLPPIRADYSQIETALLNLGTNARDAMRTVDGDSTLSIKTYVVDESAPRAAGFEGAEKGNYVAIAVSDTGPGISKDIQEKIFEPFFTTKDVGHGTGLGLATVYGIVKQSDGFIELLSAPNQGTTFIIYLPAYHGEAGVEPVAVQQKTVKKPTEYKPSDMAGHGQILLVEDEDSVRVMAAKLLRSRGYDVIEAVDGEDALDILEDFDGKIDLMISDVVMPGLDGPGLLKAARQYLGSAKVIFISGYAEEEFSDVLSTENVSFLPKPFTVKDLAARVKQELTEAEAA